MEDEQSFNLTKSAEQDKWLAEHIVLNRQFVEEAQKYKIKPLTNEFWVYYHHRDYEKYGRYGWCVAGIAQMAEDCGITQKQVENSYYQLVQKGAIQHIWCESKVYRGKSKIYASSVLLEEKGMVVTNKNLSNGRERKLPEHKEAIILDCNLTGKSVNLTGKSVNLTGKSVNLTGKSDLNNTINNTNNNSNKQNISTIVDIGDTANFGNEKINQMFLKWEEMFGYKQKDSKANRYACYNMLRAKDKGEGWLVNTMKLASESLKDRYAGKEVRSNAGFADIQKNYPKIWQWGKAKYEETKSKGKEIIL